jgi:RNA polymerase sigma-70 factor (ECF subfamily)
VSDSQANELLELASRAARDELAFQELYEKTKAYVAAVIRKSVPLIQDADLWDVLNTVYLKLWLALQAGQCRADSDQVFLGWLAAIARNETVDWSRRGRRHIEHRRELDRMTEGWVNNTLSGAQAECVRVVLEQLGFESAQLLRLRYIDCFTCSEIAQRLGIPVTTVYARLHQARERFRELWQQRDK